ncbi:MAG: hypothetical protein QRY74_00100 [Chlamydia sp.]
MKMFLIGTALVLMSLTTSSYGANEANTAKSIQEISIQSAPVTKKNLEISLKIEPLSDEQQKTGLNMDDLRSEIVHRLHESGITVHDAVTQPVLILRVRTIQSGLDYATFFQLSLQEESMLVRNRSTFNAVTWSQASLLSCRPEDLKREVLDTVAAMVQSFSKDFIKALQG